MASVCNFGLILFLVYCGQKIQQFVWSSKAIYGKVYENIYTAISPVHFGRFYIRNNQYFSIISYVEQKNESVEQKNDRQLSSRNAVLYAAPDQNHDETCCRAAGRCPGRCDGCSAAMEAIEDSNESP